MDETGVVNVADPLGGSWYVEALTDRLEAEAEEIFGRILAMSPDDTVTGGLLRGIEDILDISLPLADLPAEARAWERGVDELAEQDAEVAEYLRTLEEAKDATDLPEASGDAIAREYERYLRRRGDRGEHGGR